MDSNCRYWNVGAVYGNVHSSFYDLPTVNGAVGTAKIIHIPKLKTIDEIIAEECRGKGVNPKVIKAIILAESGGNPNAIGDGGEAIGLGQIHPRWHKERMKRLGVWDLQDPTQNIKVIVDIMNELLDKYGNLDSALTAYNAGHDTGSRRYANKIYELISGGE